MRSAGHVGRTGERRGAYRVFVGEPKGISPLRISMSTCEEMLKWIFKECDEGRGVD